MENGKEGIAFKQELRPFSLKSAVLITLLFARGALPKLRTIVHSKNDFLHQKGKRALNRGRGSVITF